MLNHHTVWSSVLPEAGGISGRLSCWSVRGHAEKEPTIRLPFVAVPSGEPRLPDDGDGASLNRGVYPGLRAFRLLLWL